MSDILTFMFGLYLWCAHLISPDVIFTQPEYSIHKFWCKIAPSLFYIPFTITSTLSDCSVTLQPLFTPTLLPSSRRRQPRNIGHYFLHAKVLNRSSRRPPKLPQSPTQHPVTSTRFTSPTQLHRFFTSVASCLHNYINPTPPTTSVHASSPMPLLNPTPDAISKLCDHLDFIQLHKLSNLFITSTASTNTLLDNINHELSRFHSFLYSSSTHLPNVGASCVFISQHDKQQMPIVIDSGASKGLTPLRQDFLTFKPLRSTITGLGSQSEIRGVGTVCWKIVDQHGTQREAYKYT